MSIAFLGTGLLGSGFIDHLLETTSQVAVWNRTADKAARFAGAAARAARMAEAGRAFLHAPVFMSPGMARAGKGIMLACGPQDVFARVDAALATMTGDLWYLGAEPHRAAAM